MSFLASTVLTVLSSLPKPIRDRLAPEMRFPQVKNDPSKVQLARFGNVHFEHPDLEKFNSFARDFGFVEVKRTADRIYYRGYSKDPYCYVADKSQDGKPRFLGPAFVAASQVEFDKAAALEGAVVSSLENYPGGGKQVLFKRSDDIYFRVICGQIERDTTGPAPSATHVSVHPMNTPAEKPRKGRFQRYQDGPALIHKIGHTGYVCREVDKEFMWYTDNFNFVPSDILHHWDFDKIDVMTFMHLDLGKDYSDHHCLFLQRAPPEVKKSYMHHTSYEIADMDTQFMGHKHLATQGWKSVWGVGRHVLGSQIFDYWYDPSGFKIEHYADGDLVNEDTPTGREVVGPLSIWGPELPKDFGDDKTISFMQ